MSEKAPRAVEYGNRWFAYLSDMQTPRLIQLKYRFPAKRLPVRYVNATAQTTDLARLHPLGVTVCLELPIRHGRTGKRCHAYRRKHRQHPAEPTQLKPQRPSLFSITSTNAGSISMPTQLQPASRAAQRVVPEPA